MRKLLAPLALVGTLATAPANAVPTDIGTVSPVTLHAHEPGLPWTGPGITYFLWPYPPMDDGWPTGWRGFDSTPPTPGRVSEPPAALLLLGFGALLLAARHTATRRHDRC